MIDLVCGLVVEKRHGGLCFQLPSVGRISRDSSALAVMCMPVEFSDRRYWLLSVCRRVAFFVEISQYIAILSGYILDFL